MHHRLRCPLSPLALALLLCLRLGLLQLLSQLQGAPYVTPVQLIRLPEREEIFRVLHLLGVDLVSSEQRFVPLLRLEREPVQASISRVAQCNGR